MKPNINVGRIILSAIIFIIIYSIGHALLFQPYKPSQLNNVSPNNITTIDQLLKVSCDSVNAICPQQIDSITEVLNAVVLPNKTFQYNNVLKIEADKYDLVRAKADMRKPLFDEWTNSKTFKMLRDSGVTIIYNYTTPKGEFLFNEIFKPNDDK